jgi:SAM-dependent methyltransferase
VLDLGGEWPFWQASGLAQSSLQLTLLNVSRPRVSLPAHVRFVSGSALNFAERLDPDQFDVVVSNSVIGHVGGWDQQRQMAIQILRFGKPFYLQTPNHWFFLDWRTLLPGFHWLPPRVQASMACRVRCGRWRRSPTRQHALDRCLAVRNLTRAELSYLFPQARIHPERVGGFVKSWMLVGWPEQCV